MDIWLERFVLAVLAAVFISLVLLNVMKFDAMQRITLGVAAVALSIFVAHTIQVTRAQAKPPVKLPQSAASNGPSPAPASPAASGATQNSPQQQQAKPPKKPKPKPTEVTQPPAEGATGKDKPRPEQPPPVQNIAPGGFAISGGTVVNPTVNNILGPKGRLLSDVGANNVVSGLKKLQGNALVVMYEPITDEMNHLGGQLQQIFIAGGWKAPGIKSNDGLTNHITVLDDDGQHVFTPDGIHCVGSSETYKQVLSLLQNSGLKCENAMSSLYKSSGPTATITIFIGRNQE